MTFRLALPRRGKSMPAAGLRSKLRHGIRACEGGVARVHLINSRRDDALLAELFSNEGVDYQSDNQLVIRIQPDEGILLKFGMKVPGAGFNVQNVNMDFHYKDLTDSYIPEAYQRLLLDCMEGDSTLYARGDAVEAAWEFVNPILKVWQSDPDIPLHGYPAGTWGPEMADELIEGAIYNWRYPCKNLADDGKYCEL